MAFFIYTSIFLFGLIVGSFLNVVICRIHSGEDLVKKRSHCPKCGHTLSWKELIPVFSFIIQRGKCRECGEKISWQYPAVEIATGLLFLLVFNLIEHSLLITNYSLLINLLFLWFIAGGLIIIFVYDLKHYIIPDKILFPAIVMTGLARLFGIWQFGYSGFIWNLSVSYNSPSGGWGGYFGIWHFGNLLDALVLGLIVALFFFALYFFSRGKALGFGDVKYTFFMGLFLGWPGIFTGLFIAFILGAIIGLAFIVAGKKGMKSQLPFGPFLVTGTFAALFWGYEFINWYLDLFV